MRKKIVVLLLSVSMLLSNLAGCGSKESSKEPASSGEGLTEISGKDEAEVEVEESTDPIELNWLGYSLAGKNPEEGNYVEALLEEKNNVEIHYVQDIDINNIRMQAASGGLDDITVINTWLVGQQIETALWDQGLIREFPEEWLYEYYPTGMKAIVDLMGVDVFERGDHLIDGKTLFVPNAQADSFIAHKAIAYRKDWLNNLGLKEPTTIDELHDMLYAFTYDDPDGNGKDDTYGIAAGIGWMGPWFLFSAFKLPAYIVGRVGDYMVNDDGDVIYTAVQENFKEALRIWKEWYDEGIVDPNVVTYDRTGIRDSWMTGKAGVLVDNGTWMSSTLGEAAPNALLRKMDPDAKVEFLGPLSSEYGDGIVYGQMMNLLIQGSFNGTIAFGVNATDEQVIATLKVLESIASDSELAKCVFFGEEGVDYTIDETTGSLVRPDTYTPEYEASRGIGLTYYGFGVKTEEVRDYGLNDADIAMIKKTTNPNTIYYDGNWPKRPTDVFNTYTAEINKIESEFFNGVLLDIYDLDTDWEEYVSKMYASGLDKVIAAYQEQVDAMK